MSSPALTIPAPARLGRTAAFWLLAATLALMLFASSAPSPLYVVYQQQWNFSPITLTSVFAVYALALLGSLVVAGSLSDHVGRRPTLLAALAIEMVGMLAFAAAQSVEWLFAARTLQGVATGMAMGAISAALLDLQPAARPRLGALVGVAAPLSGLAAGALATGLLVQYGPDPTRLVFWLLLGGFALAALTVAAVPETVEPVSPWRHAVRPRFAVPRGLRSPFVAAIPSMAAAWALGGLILSLGPSLTARVLGDASHTAGGLPIFVLAGMSALASVWLRDVHARTTARGGLVALIAGIGLVLVALVERSTPLFIVAAAVAGMGFGPAFAGSFRALTALAPAHERASFVSAILSVAYLSFSLPAVAAGVAVTQVGLHATADVYGALLIGLAAVALLLSGRVQEPAPAV
jgi:MFS family permease